MVRESVAVVRGKQVVFVEGEALRSDAARHTYTVMDLGTGDGRWIYRLAQRHSNWLCIGVDANAAQMRDASFRAGRKLSRGGARNLWFVRGAVEALPHALDGLADELHIYFPWRSLLVMVIRPDPTVLANIARLGKPGAILRVRINATILDAALLETHPRMSSAGGENLVAELEPAFAAAGIRLVHSQLEWNSTRTSWSRRLNRGTPGRVLSLDATIVGSSSPQ